MKTSKLLIASLFMLGLFFSHTFAQTDYNGSGPQVVRNTSPITYTVDNTEAVDARFTWDVSGGTILVGGVAQTSPYTTLPIATGTSTSISVRWDNTNTTSVNGGTLRVSKTVGTLSCPSAVFTLNVQSWVAPSASVTTPSFAACSGVASSVNLAFQGNAGTAGYLYRWRVVRTSDNFVEQDHTTTDISSATATATVNIAAITNASAAPVQYRFELTRMQDAFSDMNGNVTAASVLFNVNPVPTISTINSSTSLTPR